MSTFNWRNAKIGTIRLGRIQKKTNDGKTTLVYPVNFIRKSLAGSQHGWIPVEGTEGVPVVYGSKEYDSLVSDTGGKYGLMWSNINNAETT